MGLGGKIMRKWRKGSEFVRGTGMGGKRDKDKWKAGK